MLSTDILIIAVFTFQYGSNQIVTESTIHEVLREFTLQYGSNQINVEIKVQYQDFYNLHSNMVLIKFNNFEKITTNEYKFTFQYGSNQMGTE